MILYEDCTRIHRCVNFLGINKSELCSYRFNVSLLVQRDCTCNLIVFDFETQQPADFTQVCEFEVRSKSGFEQGNSFIRICSDSHVICIYCDNCVVVAMVPEEDRMVNT